MVIWYDSLRGHYSLQTASEDKYDLIFLPAGSCQSMIYDSPLPPPLINKLGAVGTSKDVTIYVIEVTDFNSEVRINL